MDNNRQIDVNRYYNENSKYLLNKILILGELTMVPSIEIKSPTTDPTHSTARDTINISGDSSVVSGKVDLVEWENSSTGDSGVCIGTTTWSQDAIRLRSGINVITVTATTDLDETNTDTLTVSYSGLNPKPAIEFFIQRDNLVADWKNFNIAGADPSFTRLNSLYEYPSFAHNGNLELGGDTIRGSMVVYSFDSEVGKTYDIRATVDPMAEGGASPAYGYTSPRMIVDEYSNTLGTDEGEKNVFEVTTIPNNTTRIMVMIYAGLVGSQKWQLTDFEIYSNDQEPVTDTETDSRFISISGTSSIPDGSISSVNWRTDSGNEGVCVGTTDWSKDNIILSEGPNVITVTAISDFGESTEITMNVTYTPPIPNPSPNINIETPSIDGPINLFVGSINISGSSNISSGNIANITWSNSTGGEGTCTGIENWSQDNISLVEGLNEITITATSDLNEVTEIIIPVTYISPIRTTNITTALANKFRFEFSDKDFLPLNDGIIGVNMPGFSLGVVNRKFDGVDVKLPGSSFTIDDLNLTFKSDGEYKYWIDIFKWMADNFKGAEKLVEGTLFLLDYRDDPIFEIILSGIFAENLTSLNFNRTEDTPDVLTFDVVLKVNGIDYSVTH